MRASYSQMLVASLSGRAPQYVYNTYIWLRISQPRILEAVGYFSLAFAPFALDDVDEDTDGRRVSPCIRAITTNANVIKNTHNTNNT